MAEAPGARSPVPAGLAAWPLALLTALAYAAVGGAALLLAGPPGYAAPLYPAAGIALVACLVGGTAALPGVFIGALAVNAGVGLLRGADDLVSLGLLPAVLALGATLQAQLGTWLLRRHVGLPLVLNAPRDIARAGGLGGPVACLASATVATAALALAGVIDRDAWLLTWATWWLGDTLGVLIAAPLVLTLVGRPRDDWRPRRRTVGLPLLAALGVLALAMQELRGIDAARQRDRFTHDATQLAVLVQQRLQEALHALQALDAAARVAGQPPSPAQLQQASAWWLAQLDSLQAVGVGHRVPLAAVDVFEAQARQEGPPDFRVFDRDDGSDRRQRGELLVVRHLEPAALNRGAFGVNSLSIDATRPAIEASRDSGEPRVSAAFRLTQSERDEPGVVVYQALYAPGSGDPASVAERRERWTGAVFVTLRTEPALAGLDGTAAARLSWCLLDADPAAPVRRLASGGLSTACDEPDARQGHHTERPIHWAGRAWLLRMSALPAVSTQGLGELGLLSGAGLAAVTLLGALLLVVTGHSRRTELAVASGTEQLRAEVAERRHAEAEQQETRERLQGILDNAPLGVLFLDPQGLVLECNARFADMAGVTPEALLGDSVMALAHPEDREPLAAMRRDLLRGAATRSVATVRLRAAGPGPRWTPVRVIASALRDEQGQVLRVVAVVEDVADQLRLQASEQARLRAESANRAKNEFLSRMSHELRTPLNAMIGFAQLLGLDREPALAQHQRDWAQQIQRAGWHLLELINETLDLSRIESGSVSLAPQPLDLRRLAEATRSLVASAAAQRGIVIEVSADPGVPAGVGDATRVRQVLTNLLTNAVKYNRPGGAVRVHVARTGEDQVAVSVADTGLGMDAAQQARLFQPYDRLGREGSGIEGTGIGLVISQRLLELMGGTLAVESQAGQGSVFTFTLPATDEAAADEPDAVESLPAPYAQRLVHYVEDNPTNVEVMRGVLAQRPQVRLEVSTLGLDGLAAIRREPPDLILLDMQLPDIAGPELLRFLKNDDTLAKIPVIVVSADATPDHVRKALTLGALHYLTKPLDVASFLAHVDEALESMETRWGL
jgi:PAS domain S-box-containing protein